jgi:hypothetical protein
MHTEGACYLGNGLALVDQPRDEHRLLRRELRRSAELHTALLDGDPAGAGAFPDQGSLGLGDPICVGCSCNSVEH